MGKGHWGLFLQMKVDCFIQLRVLGMFYTTRGRLLGTIMIYAGEVIRDSFYTGH